jgi:hypothetical protein
MRGMSDARTCRAAPAMIRSRRQRRIEDLEAVTHLAFEAYHQSATRISNRARVAR